jgi:hypothetical protein
MQRPDPEALQKLVQPLADALTKAYSLTEGKRTDAFNHQKAVAESLLALSWVCYTGRDCGTARDLRLVAYILHLLLLPSYFHFSFDFLVKECW